ncbi:preprotein translocase subunit YajC [Actinomyces culturomici]|uniref:preprotein translocase subunit YajC n=1 Tax=Actinomyces culturomici TaxID=1926276 RepID=UPI001F470742|nr:preprotein translocase subunit YajC [Actinomyces culturomici]
MQAFLSQYSMYILLGAALIAMMWFSNRSRQKQVEKQAEREKELAANLVPGAWVRTAVGFWGRFVDEDGDVVVLETADGTEMYWDRQMIREAGVQPPFAADEAEEVPETAAEEPVLGLDQPESGAPEEKN